MTHSAVAGSTRPRSTGAVQTVTRISIGSLLYHVGLVEMSWLFLDVLCQAFPDDVKADFPLDMATRCGLTQVTGAQPEASSGEASRL